MNSREERRVRNEAIAREINEGLERAQQDRAPEDHVRMVCECGDPRCEGLIAITLGEYERTRSDSTHFVVVKDHVDHSVEHVVEETSRFAVVEKNAGEPARITEREDPRR